MSKPARLNINFYPGDDERFTIFWENPPGTPADDITGAAIRMQIRKGPADSFPVVVEASIGDGITIVDGPGAEFQVFFSLAKTLQLSGKDKFFYDIQIKPVSGDLKTLLEGELRVGLERTRDP